MTRHDRHGHHNGLTPQQIHTAYPYLSLARIHSALSYYIAHQSEIDAEIIREVQESKHCAINPFPCNPPGPHFKIA